jgi:hypothetical protein
MRACAGHALADLEVRDGVAHDSLLGWHTHWHCLLGRQLDTALSLGKSISQEAQNIFDRAKRSQSTLKVSLTVTLPTTCVQLFEMPRPMHSLRLSTPPTDVRNDFQRIGRSQRIPLRRGLLHLDRNLPAYRLSPHDEERELHRPGDQVFGPRRALRPCRWRRHWDGQRTPHLPGATRQKG